QDKWAKCLAYTQRDMLLMRRLYTTPRESDRTRRLPARADFRTHRRPFRDRPDPGLGRGRQGRHPQHAPLRAARRHPRGPALAAPERRGMSRPVRPYLWMLSSELSFATMGALTKLLNDTSDWRF